MWFSWTMKYVVVGGSGWVAQTTIAKLLDTQFCLPENLVVYGSHARYGSTIDGHNFRIHDWKPKKEEFSINTLVPTAFITLDKYLKYGEEKFLSLNKELIEHVRRYIALNAPQCCILFSSGIVSLPKIDEKISKPHSIYQALKREEEESIKAQCAQTGTKLVICRLFNASGRYIQNVKHYAISNLILQALKYGKITLDSKAPVWRRYVDLGQVIELCIMVSNKKEMYVFETGGVRIELRDLAKTVALHLDATFNDKYEIERGEDSYHSQSHEFEEMAFRLGVKLLNIQEQISETAVGVKYAMAMDIDRW